MSAFVRGAQRGPGSKSLLAIAFALATVLGLSALAPASAFAMEIGACSPDSDTAVQ